MVGKLAKFVFLFELTIADYTSYTASATHIQRVPDMVCTEIPFEETTEPICDDDIYRHDIQCTAECSGIQLERTCSCFTSMGPIMIMRPACIWTGDEDTCAPVAEIEIAEELVTSNIETTASPNAVEIEPVQSCDPIFSGPNVTWRCSNSPAISGTTCYAKCTSSHYLSPGYEPITHAECQCDIQGDCTWNQTKAAVKKVLTLVTATIADDGLIHPQCVEGEIESGVTCPEIAVIPNAIYHCTAENRQQSRCKIQCNHGFVLNGNTAHTAKCTKKGRWNRDFAIDGCIKIGEGDRNIAQVCHEPSSHEHGHFICNKPVNGVSYFVDAEKCHLMCDPGYKSLKNSSKQNWQICRCHLGLCQWFREDTIGCIEDSLELADYPKQVVSSRGRLLMTECAPLVVDRKFRVPKCTGLSQGSTCQFVCKGTVSHATLITVDFGLDDQNIFLYHINILFHQL